MVDLFKFVTKSTHHFACLVSLTWLCILLLCISYKRRDDLEVRGIESIWIEIANHYKRILFGLS